MNFCGKQLFDLLATQQPDLINCPSCSILVVKVGKAAEGEMGDQPDANRYRRKLEEGEDEVWFDWKEAVGCLEKVALCYCSDQP